MANNKLDAALIMKAHAVRGFAATDAESTPLERVRVLVHVAGDLRAVEEAGLYTELVTGRIAAGTIAITDLDSIAGLDDVVSIQSDHTRHLYLDRSVPSIKGDRTEQILPGFSGRGVIVGVVDSGIDIFHKSFRKPDGTTRILPLLDLTQRHTIEMPNVTGGTLNLKWQPPPSPGSSTSPAANRTATLTLPVTDVQPKAALQKFPTIKTTDLEVKGGPLPGKAITIDFVGDYDGRTYDTSKIQSFEPGGLPTGNPDSTPKTTITRGREFIREEIDLALSFPIMPFHSRDTDGHGIHVAGIAAGNGLQAGTGSGAGHYVGVAPEADLIIVRTLLNDKENLQGIEHIFKVLLQLLPALKRDKPGRTPRRGCRRIDVPNEPGAQLYRDHRQDHREHRASHRSKRRASVGRRRLRLRLGECRESGARCETNRRESARRRATRLVPCRVLTNASQTTEVIRYVGQ